MCYYVSISNSCVVMFVQHIACFSKTVPGILCLEFNNSSKVADVSVSGTTCTAL